MGVSDYLFVCLLSALPGPPGVRIDDAYVQLFPISKHKCHEIDPLRDIAFHLFTRHNPLQQQLLKIGDDKALEGSHLNFSEPTVLFFHAFFESSQATTATILKTAYLQRGDHNIILLNAPRLEAGPWYVTASKNTQIVGQYTAKFIDYLVSRGLHLPSLHLLGLSLGAQMAGVCGSSVKSGRISRITGMDPAGPLFTKWPKSLKLDSGDAEFVDVIHTDAGIFGYPRQIGHVDFWPNQGISPQPGCRIKEVKRRSPDSVIEPFFCSHWRSYQFYAESVINPRGFRAIKCTDWIDYVNGKCDPNQVPVSMGFGVDWNARGNHFLQTNNESPFSMEQEGIIHTGGKFESYNTINDLPEQAASIPYFPEVQRHLFESNTVLVPKEELSAPYQPTIKVDNPNFNKNIISSEEQTQNKYEDNQHQSNSYPEQNQNYYDNINYEREEQHQSSPYHEQSQKSFENNQQEHEVESAERLYGPEDQNIHPNSQVSNQQKSENSVHDFPTNFYMSHSKYYGYSNK